MNPAFEDPVYYLQRERQLPINVDPVDNRLEDPEERERVRRVFERGLKCPSAMVLPLQRGPGQERSGMADGTVDAARAAPFSDAGRFACGLRLPLPGLPWVASPDAPQVVPVDPMVNRGPLPIPPRNRPIEGPRPQARNRSERDRKPDVGESAPWIVRTALCVEPRNGRLYVFMPPLMVVEDYWICWLPSKTRPRI